MKIVTKKTKRKTTKTAVVIMYPVFFFISAS